jgi:excinuclease ABC subunit C
MNYGMGRCLGPCCEEVDPSQYREVVQQVKMFLAGKNLDLLDVLKKKMGEESEALHFEAAAKIRDQIASIEQVVEKQKIVSTDFLDQDVIGFHRQDHKIVLYPLFVRAGRLMGGRGFVISSAGVVDEEVLSSFVFQYYRAGKFIPEQILIPRSIPEQDFVEQWLTELKGRKVKILVPRKGDKRHLLEMASENAEQFLLAKDELDKDEEKLLDSLKERLHLRNFPRRIEAFDISNFQGGNAVGSMVSFEDGEPDKERYRHFKIKTIEGADDYGMMYEVLLRRYQKATEENDFPDLVLLDGGRGQLNVAQEVFKELGITKVDLISLAKERFVEEPRRSRLRKTEEKVFHPQYKGPFILGRHSAILHLLDRVRDEAHRFAITHHKKVRGRETVKSEIGEIPGIGAIRQRELLRFFGTVEKIKQASEEELAKAPKMNSKSAQRVYEFYHNREE